MGDGGDDGTSSPPERHRDFFSERFDAFRRREERQRAQTFQAGLEPSIEWNVYDDGKSEATHILVVAFPGDTHFITVFEPPLEWGHVLTWCFVCRARNCAGCKWAHAEYVQRIRDVRRASGKGVAKPSDDELPF